jgi:large subunit ribosomal protein L16
MLFPKKVKHRKWQTARKSPEKLARPETRGIAVSYGEYGLKALSPSRVKSNQIEAARRVISRTMGDPDHFVFEVRPGRILFEIDGVPEDVAREAFRKATAKLPLQAKFVRREDTRI